MIDFTKAPEGATHWGPETDYYHKGWRRFSKDKWYFSHGGEWLIARVPYDKRYIDLMTKKPELIEPNNHTKQERYKHPDGEDYLDKFFASKTQEEVRGAMSFTIGKYMDRLGKKDDILKEVTKIADYSNRWMEYEKSLAEGKK